MTCMQGPGRPVRLGRVRDDRSTNATQRRRTRMCEPRSRAQGVARRGAQRQRRGSAARAHAAGQEPCDAHDVARRQGRQRGCPRQGRADARLTVRLGSVRAPRDRARVQRHPWVLHGLDDPERWLAETDPGRQELIVVSEEEVSTAFSFFVRCRRGLGGIGRRGASALAVD